jgi:hypothetical protein
MAILFSVVARQNIVLARHADCVGNFAEVTEQLLAKIDSAENIRKTYSHGRYLYHYVCYNGLIFMCIAGIPAAQTWGRFLVLVKLNEKVYVPLPSTFSHDFPAQKLNGRIEKKFRPTFS